jgi:hypothetical protein
MADTLIRPGNPGIKNIGDAEWPNIIDPKSDGKFDEFKFLY